MKTQISIDPFYLQQAKSFTYLKDGEIRTKYTMNEQSISYIEYKDYNQTLQIQVSIPNFLHSNNVILIGESEVSLFFERLQERLQKLFNVNIMKEDWYAIRIDVCWNFHVNEQIDEYLKQLAKIKLPYLKPKTHGHLETVEHSNKSKRISFYNKHKESIKNKHSKEVIAQAKGLLRMEINCKNKILSRYSSRRKATDYLTKQFFDHITQPIINQIELSSPVEGLSYHWIESQSFDIKHIEKLIGFQFLQKWLSPIELQQLYPASTYDRRMNLSREIIFPLKRSLAPLKIEFKNNG